MISDKLYELAFQYRKTKIWNILYDAQVFAVELSDGETGYVSIMGRVGEYHALAVYIGEKGFNSLYKTAMADEFRMSELQFREHLLQQDCLQCIWESRADIPDEEREDVKKYANSHNVKIAGKNPYPRFLKYSPNHIPWRIQTEKEEEYLCDALRGAIALADLFHERNITNTNLPGILQNPEYLPMLQLRAGGYKIQKTPFPKYKETEFPAPEANNDISIARLKKASKVGIWECEIIRFPEPVQNEPDEVPFFPVIMLAVESAMDYILPVSPMENYEENAEKLLDVFIKAFLEQDICPLEIKARDKRTYSFLKSFCERLKIKLTIEEDLPALENAEFDFMERFGKTEGQQVEDMIAILEEMMNLSEEELRQMPEEMEHMINLLMEKDILPEEIKDKIRTKFSLDNKKKKKHSKVTKLLPEQTYVISVSLGTGCYRHIRISGKSTLFDLHEAIQSAFCFDDDHAHAFFMDNVKWSDRDCYYMSGIDDDRRSTSRFRLNQIGLHKGMLFKYIFDFGDEWLFQCRVLKVLEEGTKEPVVVRSKGEAPEQYGWDDDWDE